jgi:iron complex outermembrane receptor protein
MGTVLWGGPLLAGAETEAKAHSAPVVDPATALVEPEASASAQASAAAAVPASSNAEEDDEIEVIVVTAQGREQNSHNVPIGVTAVTAEKLQAMGADSIEELAVTTSSLTLTGRVGNATPIIRGVGSSTNNGGTESAVAVYVDGAYIPSIAGMKFSFNNIERIEVLKGPQGTLYGRNATGGLINIITREPTSKPTLIAGLRLDDYQTAEQTFYGSMGLAQDLAGDLAVFHSDQNQGYGRNKANGHEIYESGETGLRSSLLWTPAPATRLRLSADYTNVDTSKGVGRQADRGARTIDGQGPQADYHDVNSNLDPFYIVEGGGAALKATHEFQGLKLLSLSAYRDGRSHFSLDLDASPAPIVNLDVQETNRSLSQTLQLQSNDDGPMTWVAGLYYFDYSVDYLLQTRGSLTTPIGGLSIVESSMDTTSYAAYAQATYAIDPETHVTLGLRHTEDERKFSGAFRRPNATAPVPTFAEGTAPPKYEADEPTWSVALDRHFNEQVLGYVSYNRGFSSGNFSMIDPNASPVRSEILDAYEVGAKTELLDRRVRINTAAFWYDYDHMQLRAAAEQGGTRLISVPGVRIRGFEIEGTWLPSARLELNAGATLLDSKFTDYPDANISEPRPAPAGGNFYCVSGQQAASSSCPESVRPRLASLTAEGNELPRAADFTGTLSVSYRQPIAVGKIGLSASAAYNDGFFWASDNRSRQHAYTMINAQIDWTSPDRRYRVYMFGKNLDDEEYSQFVTSDSYGDIASSAPPRTLGLGTELRFE